MRERVRSRFGSRARSVVIRCATEADSETRVKRVQTMRVHVAVALVLVGFGAGGSASAQDTVTYFHTDGIGSVKLTTNASGNVVAHYDYLPFGEPWPSSATSPIGFGGTEKDTETVLHYSGARYYSPGTGRFTTVDPDHVAGNVFDPQSWNAYAYARNSPLRFVDPTGTDYEVTVTGGSPFWFGGSFNQFSAFAAGFSLSGGSLSGTIYNSQGKAVGTYRHFDRIDRVFLQAGRQANAGFTVAALVTSPAWVGAAGLAGAALVPGALSGGLAAEGLSVTGRLAPLKYGKQAGKLARQMAQRGWTDDMIREAVASGQQVATTNFANGNAAIRFIHPRTGQSVIVDMITKEIIMVGGRGFRF
jgi:RHS repeat-associated protein